MKRSRLMMTISAVVCTVLAIVVVGIAFNQPKHKHKFSDARIYHITNDGVYYTRECKSGHIERFNTQATLGDVMNTATASDSIILDEDIVVKEEIGLRSFTIKDGVPKDITLNINLNLNNHKITTEVDEAHNNSLFTLNANYGQINFDIKNGSLYSEDLLYLFRFLSNRDSEDCINLNIDSVECVVKGDKATPLFAHNESANINVNASYSKFVSQKSSDETSDYGVGVFINSESEFNFSNCYFEGGDAVYVKNGTVSLSGCELVNEALAQRAGAEQQNNETFFAIGSCLATESYNTSEGATEFDITIIDCVMTGNYSSTMIYIANTAEEGLVPDINTNSSINVISCTFNQNPNAAIPEYGIINYENGQPELQDNQTWVVR